MTTVRRVAPSFSIPPPAVSEVMLGASLNLTCVAVGSPMPYVKWKKGPSLDLTPEDNLPVGRNVLMLTDIKETANYTCTAASDLGVIEVTSMVKVQCSYRILYRDASCLLSPYRIVSYRILSHRIVSYRIEMDRDGSKCSCKSSEITRAHRRLPIGLRNVT